VTAADAADAADAGAGGGRRGSGRRDVVLVATVSVVAVALLYVRLPFAAQQLWAEDGREFFADAVRVGPIEAFGHSEAGYYLTVSRVGGAIASLVPVRDAALAMWWWVAVVTAWMVATVMVSSRTWLRTWVSRIVVALALVLVPVLGQESIGNAANLQFSLLFVSLIVLIGAPAGRVERGNGGAVLVATGLTTPLAVALAPLALVRMMRRRSWRPDALVVAWLLGVGAQWMLIAVTQPETEVRTADSVSVLVQRLEVFGVELNLVPVQFERYRGPIFLMVFAGATMAVALLAWRRRERARAVLLLAVPATGIAMMAVVTLAAGSANRYLVFTALCLTWTVMAGAETLGDSLHRVAPSARLAVATAAGAVLVVTFAINGESSELRRSGPTWQVALADARARCAEQPNRLVRVQIAPLRPEKPDQWSVLLTCAELD
jgi:hypothetical protein